MVLSPIRLSCFPVLRAATIYVSDKLALLYFPLGVDKGPAVILTIVTYSRFVWKISMRRSTPRQQISSCSTRDSVLSCLTSYDLTSRSELGSRELAGETCWKSSIPLWWNG